MIQDFRETLEVTPLSSSDSVSEDVRANAPGMTICQFAKIKQIPWVHHVFLQIEPRRICVCVRKRPLNKQGRPEISNPSLLSITRKFKINSNKD